MIITRADGSIVMPAGDSLNLTLLAGETYTVSLTESGLASLSSVAPIKSIAQSIGNDDSVAALSHAFYRRVFADDDESGFRALFASSAGSAHNAAEDQWRWLLEMWGGAKRYSEKHGQGALVTRMLSKHGASRMAYCHCDRWLRHMLAAADEVCMGGHPAMGRALAYHAIGCTLRLLPTECRATPQLAHARLDRCRAEGSAKRLACSTVP